MEAPEPKDQCGAVRRRAGQHTRGRRAPQSVGRRNHLPRRARLLALLLLSWCKRAGGSRHVSEPRYAPSRAAGRHNDHSGAETTATDVSREPQPEAGQHRTAGRRSARRLRLGRARPYPGGRAAHDRSDQRDKRGGHERRRRRARRLARGQCRGAREAQRILDRDFARWRALQPAADVAVGAVAADVRRPGRLLADLPRVPIDDAHVLALSAQSLQLQSAEGRAAQAHRLRRALRRASGRRASS